VVVAASDKLRLYFNRQILPKSVVVNWRIVVIRIVIGIPPIRKAKLNEIETGGELGMMAKEMFFVSETMVASFVRK